MRKLHLPFLLILVTLLISCGREAATTSTATPQPTAEIAAVAEATATDEPTTEPTATDTAVPATNTPLPEPPTATSPSTSTPTSDADEATATIEVDQDPTASATGSESNATAAASTPSGPPPPAPPASPGGVTAPTDANYPANTDKAGWENRITVPAGFEVSYYGRVEGQPTSITFSPVDGQLYIAVQAGTIYKMDSSGGVSTYAGGFTVPTGIAFRPGTNQLDVSSRVRDENIGGEAQVSVVNRGQLIGGLPCCYTFFHSANGIAFGPDGYGLFRSHCDGQCRQPRANRVIVDYRVKNLHGWSVPFSGPANVSDRSGACKPGRHDRAHHSFHVRGDAQYRRGAIRRGTIQYQPNRACGLRNRFYGCRCSTPRHART
jgi:hypothetical protein